MWHLKSSVEWCYCFQEDEVVDSSAELRCSSDTAKVLNLLAFLMNQAPVKAAFVNLASAKTKYANPFHADMTPSMQTHSTLTWHQSKYFTTNNDLVFKFRVHNQFQILIIPSSFGFFLGVAAGYGVKLIHFIRLWRLFCSRSIASDEKYSSILTRLSERLNTVSSRPAHVAAQESIVVSKNSIPKLKINNYNLYINILSSFILVDFPVSVRSGSVNGVPWSSADLRRAGACSCFRLVIWFYGA